MAGFKHSFKRGAKIGGAIFAGIGFLATIGDGVGVISSMLAGAIAGAIFGGPIGVCCWIFSSIKRKLTPKRAFDKVVGEVSVAATPMRRKSWPVSSSGSFKRKSKLRWIGKGEEVDVAGRLIRAGRNAGQREC